jgi:phage/plasmid-associated DNA primase
MIPPQKQDKRLLDKLYAEREGIVHKAVMALREVIANGYAFNEPECVSAAKGCLFCINTNRNPKT